MGDIEQAAFALSIFALGIILGNRIGWYRAMRRIQEYGRITDTGAALLLEADARPVIRRHYYGLWTGEYMGHHDFGFSADHLLQKLYQQNAANKGFKFK